MYICMCVYDYDVKRTIHQGTILSLFIKYIPHLLNTVGITAILRTSVVNLESFYAEERPNEENRASWVGAKRKMPAHSNLAEVVKF